MTKILKSGTFLVGGELKINRLGFGAMQVTGSGIWGFPKDRMNAINVLKRAIELGVNFIDTADAYGPYTSEELIAEALYPYPDDLVIATKGGFERSGPGKWDQNGKPEHLKKAIEGSLKRLKLNRIDLYQHHTIDPKVPLEDSLGSLAELQKEGKIRFVGVSNYKIKDLKKAKEIVDVVSLQNRYNISYREQEDVLNYCEEKNIGFIPWYPLAAGNLSEESEFLKNIAEKYNSTPFQISIAWLLKKSKVMLPIPGTSSISHLEENMKSDDIKLSNEDFERICEFKK